MSEECGKTSQEQGYLSEVETVLYKEYFLSMLTYTVEMK